MALCCLHPGISHVNIHFNDFIDLHSSVMNSNRYLQCQSPLREGIELHKHLQLFQFELFIRENDSIWNETLKFYTSISSCSSQRFAPRFVSALR